MQDQVPGPAVSRLLEIHARMRRPEVLIFLPFLALMAFWIGGERALLMVAMCVPILYGVGAMLRHESLMSELGAQAGGGQVTIPKVVGLMDRVLRETGASGRTTACLVIKIDDFDLLLSRHGMGAMTEILAKSGERLVGALRDGDLVALMPDGGFAAGLRAERRIELEAMIQLGARLQAALTPAINIGQATFYVTGSVGFCLVGRAAQPHGQALLEGAQMAAQEAAANGPSAIRAFTPDVAKRQFDRSALRDELESALDSGQIRPYFQPQVSTDTGMVTGFEALARWHHPERGLIPPSEFLPSIESAGLSERLSEVVLFHSLNAMVKWERAGLRVPSVGVNFSSVELRNPRLVEKLKWELDRFNLTPDRLSVEVLETVVADTDNDIIVRNMAALAKLGCRIDLDDFGTGNASIGNIRRFSVGRIKIDRSFVTRVDVDREQQKMISAVVSLAERLGIETLAEGVETGAEHAMLAQLGCVHVQGFGLARPMPYEDTEDWMRSLTVAPVMAPRLSSRVGRR